MTKPLPADADINWLRKAAKALQKTWRAEGRETKLAEAQFQIATDHGFASWRALKAHFDGGATPEQADAFLEAVGKGDVAAIHSALDHDPEIVNCIGNHPYWGGRPHPLHVAIDTNREDIFDLLIAAGADVEASGADYDNWTPLMLALSWGRDGMVQTLKQHGAKRALCVALLTGDDAALDGILAQQSWRDEKQPSGSLIGLARTPHAVHQLIAAGVSPEGTDRWGADAMETLSRLGAKGQPLVAALAEHGTAPPAEVWARMGDQIRLAKVISQTPSVAKDPKVVTAAVDFGHVDLVAWLLSQGADVNARQDFGSKGTALHSAAWNGDLAMVQCLLEHGADTSAVDEENKTTPLIWAQTARRITNNPACDDVAEHLAQL